MKLVKEILYERFEEESDPIDDLRIGINWKEKLIRHFLKSVAEDYQLDRTDDRYLGFLNVYEDGFMDQKSQEGFKLFVKEWPKYLTMANKEFGITVEEEPNLDETVFILYDENR